METAKKSKFYPWFICFIMIIVAYSSIGTCSSSFGTHLPYFLDKFGLSNTLSASINSFKTFGAMFSLIVITPFLGKLKTKYVMMLGMAIALVGWIVLAMANGYAMLCFGTACVGICYAVCGMATITAIARNWFNVHRGLAVGLVTSASGLASTINPQIIKAVTANGDISTVCLMEGALMVVAMLLIALFVTDNPAEKGMEPLGGKVQEVANEATAEPSVIKSSPYAATTVSLVLLGVFCFLLGGFNAAAWSNLSLLYTNAGWVKADMANLLSIGGFLLMATKIIFGFVSDKFSPRKCAWFFFLSCVISLVLWGLMAGIQNWYLQLVIFVFYTIGGILQTTGISVYTMDLSDEVTVKKRSATFVLINQVGSFCFSPILGWVADKTGSYGPAYILLAVLAVVGFVCVMTAYKLAEENKKKIDAAA